MVFHTQELGGSEVVVQEYPPPTDQPLAANKKPDSKMQEPQFSLPPDVASMVADMAKQAQQQQQKPLEQQTAVTVSDALPPNMQVVISRFMVCFKVMSQLEKYFRLAFDIGKFDLHNLQ